MKVSLSYFCRCGGACSRIWMGLPFSHAMNHLLRWNSFAKNGWFPVLRVHLALNWEIIGG